MSKKKPEKKKNKKVGFFTPLFKPKLFKEEMLRGQIKGAISTNEKREIAAKGMDRMEKLRGKGWVNFFLWMPILGFFIFYREGKKAEKEDN